eukprot:630410_1
MFYLARGTHPLPHITKSNTTDVIKSKNRPGYGSPRLRDLPGRYFHPGYLVNHYLESEVWDRVFGKKVLDITPRDHTLLVTEPPFNFPQIQEKLNEIVFERFGFKAYCRVPSAQFSLRGYQDKPSISPKLSRECAMVVDSGFSFTHTTPVFRGSPVNQAVRRIDVGGKVLTNYLKEVVSFRKFNLMDETHLMDDIKHRLCYVSTDFESEMKKYRMKRSPLWTNFVLPNGSTHSRGYIFGSKDDPGTDPRDENTQILLLKNERIAIPEILFHPSDIDITQAGIAETVVQSIEACTREMHGMLYSNILLCGGNVLFENFTERLESEIRRLAPCQHSVQVFCD